MKNTLLALVVCMASCLAYAADKPDFSGSWVFNPSASENIGMMNEVKMTCDIRQSESALDVDTHSVYQGQNRDDSTHYDLTGKSVTNQSPMAGPAQTVSKWDSGKLVTSWTSQGAVSGTTTTRIETRSLSGDGKTMTVRSARGNNPAMVLIFDKKK